jgi:hypothetical protein
MSKIQNALDVMASQVTKLTNNQPSTDQVTNKPTLGSNPSAAQGRFVPEGLVDQSDRDLPEVEGQVPIDPPDRRVVDFDEERSVEEELDEVGFPLGRNLGLGEGEIGDGEKEDEDVYLEESRREVFSRIVELVHSELPVEYVIKPEVVKASYAGHALFEVQIGADSPVNSISLSQDQSTPKNIYEPLNATFSSGKIKKFFSNTLPTSIKSNFKSHAILVPDVAEAPKEPMFAKISEEDSVFFRCQDKLLYQLGSLQQQNQILLHTMYSLVEKDRSNASDNVRELLQCAAATTVPMSDLLSRTIANMRLRQRDLYLKGPKVPKEVVEPLRTLPVFAEELFPGDIPKIVEEVTRIRRARNQDEAFTILIEKSAKENVKGQPKPKGDRPNPPTGRGRGTKHQGFAQNRGRGGGSRGGQRGHGGFAGKKQRGGGSFRVPASETKPQ